MEAREALAAPGMNAGAAAQVESPGVWDHLHAVLEGLSPLLSSHLAGGAWGGAVEEDEEGPDVRWLWEDDGFPSSCAINAEVEMNRKGRYAVDIAANYILPNISKVTPAHRCCRGWVAHSTACAAAGYPRAEPVGPAGAAAAAQYARDSHDIKAWLLRSLLQTLRKSFAPEYLLRPMLRSISAMDYVMSLGVPEEARDVMRPLAAAEAVIAWSRAELDPGVCRGRGDPFQKADRFLEGECGGCSFRPDRVYLHVGTPRIRGEGARGLWVRRPHPPRPLTP